ncbi:DDE-type integrase/transposase/recombinase [Liquorilactobacillus ghanensis]|uniref:DDE-type integrase/transposase/recombinase n=1 Tax=Liquorilactobacillus ghanensis TaxID=399370 RepID=UPI0012EDFC8C
MNQKWCADITYIETQADGWIYLSTIMDLHSKMIIGYSFSKTDGGYRFSAAHLGLGN